MRGQEALIARVTALETTLTGFAKMGSETVVTASVGLTFDIWVP